MADVVPDFSLVAQIEQADRWSTRRSKIRDFQTFWYEKIANDWELLYQEIERKLQPHHQPIGMTALLRPKRFYETQIFPKIKEGSTQLLDDLSREIQLSLNELEEHLQFDNIQNVSVAGTPNQAPSSIADIAGSVIPLAGAAGVAGWTATGSVMTTGAMFGLISTSSVSLPILAVGVTVAAVSGSIGVLNTNKLTKARQDKLRNAILDEVHKALVYSPDSDALSQRMQKSIHRISQQLLARESIHSSQAAKSLSI